jgi:hypothetical protein
MIKLMGKNKQTLRNYPNLSSILVPGVVDRWAVDRWWHKYCLYSFPMKVKTRKAFRRAQGLPRDVSNSIYLVFTSVTRQAAWSQGAIYATATKSMELNTGFAKRMLQISNRPPKPETLPKNRKSYGGSPAGLDG